MPKEIKVVLWSLLLGLGLGICFEAGYWMGGNSSNLSVDDPYLDSVVEAWEIISEDYVENENVDHALLSQYAIEGMIEALGDPYTLYMDPVRYQIDQDDTSGIYGGIGARVSIVDGRFVVVSVLDGTPADVAGIKNGDVILEIDGETTEGMTLSEAILKVRGDVGTSVRLLVIHVDETQPVQITIDRAEIEDLSINSRMIGSIGFIQIQQFSGNTSRQFSEALKAVIEAGATGIVLDLRDNPGGLLSIVLDIASCFITDGNILNVRYNDGSIREYDSTDQEVTTDLPVVVLVNTNSASASEVLAGALQDHKRALIAGEITYGKGSVNTLNGLPDGSGLYITIARWLTPNGNLIEGVGIIPDSELTLTGDDAVQWAVGHLTGNS